MGKVCKSHQREATAAASSAAAATHNGMDGEQYGCVRVFVSQRATAVLPLDTTNPAAYKTIEDFQSDEVTKGWAGEGGV